MNKSSAKEESSLRTNAIDDVVLPFEISPRNTEQLKPISD